MEVAKRVRSLLRIKIDQVVKQRELNTCQTMGDKEGQIISKTLSQKKAFG
jgi:hypothetical protein